LSQFLTVETRVVRLVYVADVFIIIERSDSNAVKHVTGQMPSSRPLSRIFQKIRLAKPYFRLISGLAEFLRKLRNSTENTPEYHKFGQQTEN